MIFTGNCALENMGFKTFGFAGGREDVFEPEDDIYWGPESEWLADKRYTGERDLERPLGAVQMGLIYVNPEGPNGNPDPLKSAVDIRDTFARMAMNDEETVALIAGGHTFGKAHGAGDPGKHVGPEPEGAPIEQMGLGWKNSMGSGCGCDAITSGLEGAWTAKPTEWDNGFFDLLFGHEWELGRSPAGAQQWHPKGGAGKDLVPDAHDASKKHPPVMFTTDLALRFDPVYGPISKRFHENPDQFAEAFAKAWYKLTHRDMGPVSRCLGPLVPPPQLWQDPVPAATSEPIGDAEIASLKAKILGAGLSTSQLVSTAWASAATYRGTDRRGGANGARIRLAPQKDWPVNAGTAEVIAALEKVQAEFNSAGGKQVSLADLIVLGGTAAVEEAAKKGGTPVNVAFAPGRTDATAELTDAASFAVLEPAGDGFRNYLAPGVTRPATELLIDRASMLTLSAPEMTALVGGLRTLGVTVGGAKHGVLTTNPGTLSTDFFANVLDVGTTWTKTGDDTFEGKDAKGAVVWTATSVDLVFGSNAQLRALCEVYASNDAKAAFAATFAAAWTKVMNLDRYDLA